jgi:hypothetical protein
MSAPIKEAETAVNKYLLSDEDQLYVDLGVLKKANDPLSDSYDPSVGSSYEPDIAYDETQMGPLDFLRDLGKKFFDRIRPMAYELICGTDPDSKKQREDILKSFGVSDAKAAITSGLVVILMSNLGLAAAIAAVMAALIVKLFFKPAYAEFCEALKPEEK